MLLFFCRWVLPDRCLVVKEVFEMIEKNRQMSNRQTLAQQLGEKGIDQGVDGQTQGFGAAVAWGSRVPALSFW